MNGPVAGGPSGAVRAIRQPEVKRGFLGMGNAFSDDGTDFVLPSVTYVPYRPVMALRIVVTHFHAVLF
jgi:hypothetical protein